MGMKTDPSLSINTKTRTMADAETGESLIVEVQASPYSVRLELSGTDYGIDERPQWRIQWTSQTKDVITRPAHWKRIFENLHQLRGLSCREMNHLVALVCALLR